MNESRYRTAGLLKSTLGVVRPDEVLERARDCALSRLVSVEFDVDSKCSAAVDGDVKHAVGSRRGIAVLRMIPDAYVRPCKRLARRANNQTAYDSELRVIDGSGDNTDLRRIGGVPKEAMSGREVGRHGGVDARRNGGRRDRDALERGTWANGLVSGSVCGGDATAVRRTQVEPGQMRAGLRCR